MNHIAEQADTPKRLHWSGILGLFELVLQYGYSTGVARRPVILVVIRIESAQTK